MPGDDTARKGTPTSEQQRRGYERAVLAEIQMLIQFVAASSDRTLTDLKVRDPGDPQKTLDFGEVVSRLEAIAVSLDAESPARLEPSDAALLQFARDALTRLASPASGITVAYTALVTGNRRGPGVLSRATLAEQAYPGRVSIARLHRRLQWLFLFLAFLVTVVAVGESAHVALGRNLLQTLAELRTQQAGIAAEKLKLESSLDRAGDNDVSLEMLVDKDRVRLRAFAVCDRAQAAAWYLEHATPPVPIPTGRPAGECGKRPQCAPGPLELGFSPVVRDLCGRDSVLAKNFEIVHLALRTYHANWPEMAGPVFNKISNVVCMALNCGEDHSYVPQANNDVEIVVAPVLLVWGNYILPTIFGLLGAFIYVILEYYRKICKDELSPRDTSLGWVRFVLGAVTGSCIGLFASSSAPAAAGGPANLSAALTLSASGIAFLAGFGVEGVVSLLQNLVKRVFATDQAKS